MKSEDIGMATVTGGGAPVTPRAPVTSRVK